MKSFKSRFNHKEERISNQEDMTLEISQSEEQKEKEWRNYWSLGWEDPLEKEKATHSSILA